jgi:hypothetical protein
VFERAGLSLAAARAEIVPQSPAREPLDSSVLIPLSGLTLDRWRQLVEYG